MFIKRDVFVESYLPRDLPGRERELDALADILQPTVDGEPADSCWEFGPSGVGKTSTARYLLEDLRVNHLVNSTRVECVGNSRWELLGEICAAHPRVPHHGGMGTAKMLANLEANTEDPYVVILDELDGLEDEQLLTDLASLELVSLICIGHEPEEAFSMVPDEVDRLRYGPTVEFEPYGVDALLDILEARVETGLEHGVVDAAQLERIADMAGGSARYAVQSLRSAVELGEERGHTSVHSEDVDDCFDHAKSRIREQLLASLSREHHLVYQVIRDAGQQGLRPSEILERYQEQSNNPRGAQQVRHYREKLERYELVESGGSTRWDRWTVVDETLAAPLKYPV